jgi:MYXO-CTERM domain-containing protein
MRPANVGKLCALALVAVTPASAHAYSYESAISAGCHERLAMTTLRAVRKMVPTAPLIAADSNDTALIKDVPYTLDDDMKDLTGATLTVGVRDNDLKGRGPTQLDQLAEIHGNPAGQREHCLRAIEEDEPNGSQLALEDCKVFIRERVAAALDGIDADGFPDPAIREDIDVTLELRGAVTANLPKFWIEIGKAMHTLQDSFTHTFRTPDRMKVRTVLNWIEYVNKDEVESRDGPVHRNGLDQCDGLDDLRTLNIDTATQASIELLKTTLDPALNRAQKLAAVDVLLDKYISYEAGCTFDNGWCDAPERQYQVAAGCGCSTVGSGSGGAMAIGAFGFGAMFLARRRRRRLGVAAAAALSLLGALALPGVARAQSASDVPSDAPPAATTTTTPAADAPKDPAKPEEKPITGVPTTTERKAEIVEKKHTSFFGIYAAVSGSVTDPALSPQLGVRFRLSERWTVGVDGEVNGWYGVHTSQFRTGAFNGYATVIFRTPLRFESVNLRSTANLGTSVLLIDLYGAPRGSVGIFAGLVPLGVEWKLSSSLYVIFDALGIALPVPHLTGAPFAYPQYRTTLGLELAF